MRSRRCERAFARVVTVGEKTASAAVLRTLGKPVSPSCACFYMEFPGDEQTGDVIRLLRTHTVVARREIRSRPSLLWGDQSVTWALWDGDGVLISPQQQAEAFDSMCNTLVKDILDAGDAPAWPCAADCADK